MLKRWVSYDIGFYVSKVEKPILATCVLLITSVTLMDVNQHVRASLYNNVNEATSLCDIFAPPPHELCYTTSGVSSAMKTRSGSFLNSLAHSGVTIRQGAQG